MSRIHTSPKQDLFWGNQITTLVFLGSEYKFIAHRLPVTKKDCERKRKWQSFQRSMGIKDIREAIVIDGN